MRKLVVFESPTELFVLALEDEDAFVAEYFDPECGRELEDFDREVIEGTVEILARSSWTSSGLLTKKAGTG